MSQVYTLRKDTRPDVDQVGNYSVKDWFYFAGKEIADKAIARIESWLVTEFNTHVHLSPTGTGQAALLRCLPYGIQYPQLPPGIQVLIRRNSFPGRTEYFRTDAASGVQYDARLAFFGCTADVPCYFGEILHDDDRAYLGFRRALYRVDITVPRDWEHIGLVPKRPGPNDPAWDFPRRPGDSWEAWLWGCEVDLLRKHAWPHQIQERILFAEEGGASTDPLRTWIRSFRSALLRPNLVNPPRDATGPEFLLVRKGLRACVLNTIGAFHGYKARVPIESDVVVPDYARRVLDNNRKWLYEWYEPVTDRRGIWNQPAWSSHIWAINRCRITRQALKVPLKDIIAIKTDALILTRDPGWTDDGAIGSFRKKGVA